MCFPSGFEGNLGARIGLYRVLVWWIWVKGLGDLRVGAFRIWVWGSTWIQA